MNTWTQQPTCAPSAPAPHLHRRQCSAILAIIHDHEAIAVDGQHAAGLGPQANAADDGAIGAQGSAWVVHLGDGIGLLADISAVKVGGASSGAGLSGSPEHACVVQQHEGRQVRPYMSR